MTEAAEIIVGGKLISQGHGIAWFNRLEQSELSENVSTKVNHYKGRSTQHSLEDLRMLKRPSGMRRKAPIKVRMSILKPSYYLR